MTEEKQAVRTLADNVAKILKSVNNSSSQTSLGGNTTGTISASRIIGLPSAFSSIISSLETSAAGGDAVAQQTLAALNHIAAGEFETISADTAMISKIYATFSDFITLVAEDASIGDLDVETIRAGLAEIGLLNIGTASIDMAQIKRSSTQTAFIHESVQGNVYIDDLAVSEASIVNLSAGTILLNDNSGNLVELYIDSTTGNVSTRAVSYDGDDIIDANSLNGNRIVQNSITANRLNANEIFASQGTIMNLITDNIEAARLFANQGFIQELETTVISSATIGSGLDISNNSSVTLLENSIDLLASNSSLTYIQPYEPFPTYTRATWFDPSTEDHYISTGVIIPQMDFGYDSDGILYNDRSNYYQFTINSDGELMVLVTDEDIEQIIEDNNVDFSIEKGYVFASNLWNKVENVAFSNLKVSVDGIVSEVFDSETGKSRIEQNADSILGMVRGDISVPYVKSSSVEIKDDSVKIESTGSVDIKADKFSISFNTNGTLESRSRVDINDEVGIKVSNQYGGYFQATYNKIGLYDVNGNAKLYLDNNGNTVFTGSLESAEGTFNGTISAEGIVGGIFTLGGTNNTIMVVKTPSGTNIGSWGSDGIDVTGGNISDVNISDSIITIGGTNGGSISVLDDENVPIGNWDSNGIIINEGRISGGTIDGASIVLGGDSDVSGIAEVYDSNSNKIIELNSDGLTIYKGNTEQFYIDSSGDINITGIIQDSTIVDGSIDIGNSAFVVDTNGALSVNNITCNIEQTVGSLSNAHLIITEDSITGANNSTEYGSLEFGGLNGELGPELIASDTTNGAIYLYSNSLYVSQDGTNVSKAYTGTVEYVYDAAIVNGQLECYTRTLNFKNGILISST